MTELHNLYETAIQILEKTIALGMSPEAIENTSVSALLTDKGNIYTGLNGSRLENGIPAKTCSEYEAITAMMMSGENRIIGIVSVAFKNRQVAVPCDKCRELICRINPENISCGIMTDENTALSLQMLINQSIEQKNNVVNKNNVEWQTDAEFWGNDDGDLPLYQAELGVTQQPDNGYYPQNNPQNNAQMMNNSQSYGMPNNGYYPQNNPQMMNNGQPMYGMPNNGYYPQNNPQMMNNGQPMYYNNTMPNNNMNNGYYPQNNNPQAFPNQTTSQNQNPYDYVQPVPPSTIQRNAAVSRYANVSGNIYVHSSMDSKYIAPANNSQYVTSVNSVVSGNVSRNISNNVSGNLSENTAESANSIYKQKLKDLLKTDTEYQASVADEAVDDSDDEDSSADKEMKRIAKLDAIYTKKAAKKMAKASKKANKKGFFDQFI